MLSYTRPDAAPAVFHDAAGSVIEYGNRWGGESPPEESYSVISNPERFEPLHAVAEALIDALIADYDVSVVDDVAAASDLMHPRDDVVRAVRLTPADAAAAPLTFVLTSLPSVLVHAGLLQDFFYPVCTCDACDEDVERIADQLEWEIETIVTGGFSEYVHPDVVSFRLTGPDGSRSGSGRMNGPASARLIAAERRLAAIDGWTAWRHRSERRVREEKS